MTIAEIPADEVVEMTATMHRAFCAAGCRPACHACLRYLPRGMRFQLATYSRQAEKEADFTFITGRYGPGSTTVTPEYFNCTCGARCYEEGDIYHKPERLAKTGFIGRCGRCDIVWLRTGTGWEQTVHLKDVSRDVMLCDTCTPADIEPMAAERRAKRKLKRENSPGRGCFRVGGKIVLDLEAAPAPHSPERS